MIEYGEEYEAEDTLKDKYLTFGLENDIYAVSLRYVTEILQMTTDIIPMPDTPEYVKGIISLRGEVVPIIDLRMKLGLDVAEYGDKTCMILVGVDGYHLGLIVDMASEIKIIEESEIQPGDPEASLYLVGRSSGGELVLDVIRLLKEDELHENAV